VSESESIETLTNADSCPTWFVFSNESVSTDGGCSHCVCRKRVAHVDDILCDQMQQQSYLLLGNCMTYNSSSSDEQESDAISFGGCPYVYYSNIVSHRYIALPHNISDLYNVFSTSCMQLAAIPHTYTSMFLILWLSCDLCVLCTCFLALEVFIAM